jgi:thiamine biosynthesis lipoprotein ApbE
MKLPTKTIETEYEYVLSLIEGEIDSLEKYKWNLKRFAFYEVRKNANFSKKFYKILDEVDRLTIEINNLEQQKSELSTINEQNQETR